ncbi:GtrA family protein [Patescibacteria group bacterium]|nr:GtrA family protein [Patescibacteria group bacterium]
MKKSDALISFIIGFFIGFFFFIGLKIIKIEVPYSWLLIIIFPPLSLLGMFIASLLGKKFLFILQAARFLLVGALNTFIDLGVLNFLMWIFGIAAGVSYSVFKGISFLAATVNSYFWNKYWTFEKKERKPGPKEFIKFLIITTIGFLINVGIASLVVNIIGPKFGITEVTWGNIGAFAAVFVAWIWNFIGVKFIVFKY